MRWAAKKWWNPFAVSPLMRQARRHGLSAEVAAAAVEQPSDAEMAAVAAAVDAWVRQRVADGRPPARLGLLWFLLFSSNRRQTVQLALLAVGFIVFRILNNTIFSIFMSVLADAPSDLVLLSSMPSAGAAVVMYAAAALGASTFNYLVDQSAKHLGTRVRLQLVWCVQDAAMRSTQAAAAPFPSSQVVSLAGIDAMAVSWAMAMLPYALVIPVEIAVLILLSITVVGPVSTGFAVVPLAIFIVVKMVLVRVASKKQAAARGVQAQRLDMLSESIQSNAVVKLMGTEGETLGGMAALRRREQGLLGWLALSNSYSLYSQCTLAVQMTWLAMVSRARREDLFTSSSIMTALSFYRTIANYDLYRIMSAVQNLAVASTSLGQLYAFFEAAARVGGGARAGADPGADAGPSPDPGTKGDPDAPLVELQDASFCWSLDSTAPTLTGLTFALPRGQLVGIAGPIGSGKSSLMLALLGELQGCGGSAVRHPDWRRPVAYMPQRHWLQTGTLRDNVCYAPPGEARAAAGWLEAVVEGCGMARDVADFPAGLDHFIGEAGASLSGGQRARVSLARAVHAAAAVTVLDDPLCALDPGLAAEVFRRTMAPGGLLRGPGRSVILVTTNASILAQCDVVAVVRDGAVAVVAPPAQLDPGLLAFELPEAIGNAGEESHPVVGAKMPHAAHAAPEGDDDVIQLLPPEDPMDIACNGGEDELLVRMMGEDEGEGRWAPFKPLPLGTDNESDGPKDGSAAGDAVSEPAEADHALLKGVEMKFRSRLGAALVMLGWWAALGGALLVATQGLIIYWTTLVKDTLDMTHTLSEFKGLMVLSRIVVAPITACAVVGACVHFWTFLRGSTAMQARCAASVVASPYSFFSANPASKIFGAIAGDSQLVEQALSVSMGAMWSVGAQLVATIVLSIVSLWYLVFLFLPLAVTYTWIQRRYSASVTPFARADAAARNPVGAAVATTFEGLPVVRAFRRQGAAWGELSTAVARSRGTSLAVINAAGWLAFIANVLIYNVINIVVAAALVVALPPSPESLGPTVMSNVASLSSVIGAAAMLISNVEVAMSALQRLCMLSELPSEEAVVRHPAAELLSQSAAAVKGVSGPDDEGPPPAALVADGAEEAGDELPDGWPAAGAIAYRRACAAYVWGATPALKDVTVAIPAGSSCAFVGRSGSGKSTAFLALTGMIPVVAGAVEVDGVGVGRVPLRTLRAALAVVPQQPVLFAGALRPNLDPHGRCGDAALWEALRCVGLREAVTAAGGLGADPLAAGMSQGQRQLLCLARALLRDCSVLLLDEANASVDAATERQMAATVAAFGAGELTAATGAAPRRRTVVEVAHRLEGVLSADQVVVLGAGRVVEAGPPRELAKRAGGEFADMLAAQGVMT